jgi:hypothetical protein
MRKIDTSKTTAITAHIVDQMRSIRDPYDLMMSCGHVFDVIDVEKHGTTFINYRELKNRMPKNKSHYIAMSGSYGCLPDNVAVFERKSEAINHIINTFELPINGTKADNLRKTRYTNLGRDYGADYAEIVKCECNNIGIHNGD